MFRAHNYKDLMLLRVIDEVVYGETESGFTRMTTAEIAQLKEKITADYKRKLEALELVEQMLNHQQKSQLSMGDPDSVGETT